MGRVLPMTAGGLEYFVDVMLEAELRLEGLAMARIFRVVKSNSPAFPIGFELRNPVFSDLLERLASDGPSPRPSALRGDDVPDFLEPPLFAVVQPSGPTLDALVAKAEANGFSRASLVTAAQHYCGGKTDLERLTDEDIAELDQRLTTRIEAEHGVVVDPAGAGESRPTPRARRAQ